MILDEIVVKRKEQLKREIAAAPYEKIKADAEKNSRPCISFSKAIKGKEQLSVISEVKKASPSKSVIKADFNPTEIAVEYEKCGANAVSCLTEEFYFKGSSNYFKEIRSKISIPMLRKDFIFDPYQIYEAKLIGGDCILLIAAILDDVQLKEYRDIAHSLDMDLLAEVHDRKELERILSLDFDIIGINNRNLKTFDVSLETTATLAEFIPKGKIIVSESGIKDNADMLTVKKYGADAVLIGETLMRSDSISHTMSTLRANT